MSSNIGKTGEDLNAFAAAGAENTLYASERVKQEAAGTTNFAQGTGGAYLDQTKVITNDALASAKPTVDSAADGIQNLSIDAKQSANAAHPADQPHGGFVDQARGLAAQALTTAQPYVEAGVAKAQELTGAAKHQTGTSVNQTSRAANNFQQEAGAKTDAAAAQGKHDAASYVEQAKSLAGVALGTAQGYLQAGSERIGVAHDAAKDHAAQHPQGLLGTLQNTAASVLSTTSHYVGVAQETIQPHADNAAAAIKPHVDAAGSAVKPHFDSAAEAAKPHLDAAAEAAKPYVDVLSGQAADVQVKSNEIVKPAHDDAATKIDTTVEHVKPQLGAAQETIQPGTAHP